MEIKQVTNYNKNNSRKVHFQIWLNKFRIEEMVQTNTNRFWKKMTFCKFRMLHMYILYESLLRSKWKRYTFNPAFDRSIRSFVLRGTKTNNINFNRLLRDGVKSWKIQQRKIPKATTTTKTKTARTKKIKNSIFPSENGGAGAPDKIM